MVDISSLKGVTQDSRQVKRGYLFAALPGTKVDGRDYIQAAIDHGATAVLAPEGVGLPDGVSGVELITDANPRKKLAEIASEFYARQPENIIAVTGTNGKTSVVTFAEQLMKAAGHKATSLGTLKGKMTTPDPVSLHAELADLSAAGITHLALEASSHGLDQYRLDGVKIKAAGFTNLSHDHLDYHDTMEAYFAAKSRLFSEVLPSGAHAHINADLEQSEALVKICEERRLNITTYGRKGKEFKILDVKPLAHGQRVELGILGVHKDITLPLVGEFQVMNALCALGLVIAQDPDHRTQYIQAMEKLEGAAGRLQLVPNHPKGAVYVDYAHTPDALENVLKALKPHTEGKLVCVFGCGGDRDKAKRPVMGSIASTYADTVIVTDDNPRGENPADIRAQILATAGHAQEIDDRRQAIGTAIQKLDVGDVLIIAGKGHEQGQIFADHTDPFDDVSEAKQAIESLNQNKT